MKMTIIVPRNSVNDVQVRVRRKIGDDEDKTCSIFDALGNNWKDLAVY